MGTSEVIFSKGSVKLRLVRFGHIPHEPLLVASMVHLK
jgi:hypothetical protein